MNKKSFKFNTWKYIIGIKSMVTINWTKSYMSTDTGFENKSFTFSNLTTYNLMIQSFIEFNL